MTRSRLAKVSENFSGGLLVALILSSGCVPPSVPAGGWNAERYVVVSDGGVQYHIPIVWWWRMFDERFADWSLRSRPDGCHGAPPTSEGPHNFTLSSYRTVRVVLRIESPGSTTASSLVVCHFQRVFLPDIDLLSPACHGCLDV